MTAPKVVVLWVGWITVPTEGNQTNKMRMVQCGMAAKVATRSGHASEKHTGKKSVLQRVRLLLVGNLEVWLSRGRCTSW